MQKHSSNVVYTLQSKLANVSKDFKTVLEVRSEVNIIENKFQIDNLFSLIALLL
jgi:hypothetical protein